MRGCSQNEKWEKMGKVTSKSRLGKDEYAFCYEKAHSLQQIWSIATLLR